ncbi:putative ABC transport system ATP-binding protein [Kribbella orskensis]|uniref:ABC transport system ATP-binding protein n=1 Tax=Kribbella orskensis TaxID=2512216 RepID=A0ABY2BFA3_9ACTN|nr:MULTISPECIES: ABC transporter ATP-binding protein [Kribbella]TCN36928.1 putative ABC transport system ATP-binding protein [Kribbella sp. VKM Ac-2500]TCO18352.1 putative ABC transport system ATP-binding protein [Kribbella orskensis]
MTDLALEMRRVEYAYRRDVALRGISLAVRAGEVVAVTGPSGCGKSTLLHCAAGILRPQGGAVSLVGRDLAELPEAERTRLRRTQAGVVLQFGQLVPDLSLMDNVALPLLLEGHDRDAARRAALGWLERVGVAGDAAAVPGELSGGQNQRAAVARALVTGPAIVFADEPTGSLDSHAGEQMMELLLASTRDGGAALMMVTHDNLIAAYADREIRLRDGVIQHEVALS